MTTTPGGRWTLGVDPGRSTGGACLIGTDGDVRELYGWARHGKRGMELWTREQTTAVSPGDSAGVASLLAYRLMDSWADGAEDPPYPLDLRIEEPSHAPGGSSAGVYRAIGQWEGAFGSEAVLVPYREWVRHHGMRPSDGKAEIRKSVLSLAAHLVGGWKAPAAVREAAAEAYLIALCARGETP